MAAPSRAAAQTELVCSVAAIQRQFEVIRAAEERADRTGRRFRIGRHQPIDDLAVDGDADRPVMTELIEAATVDVRHQIAESVDEHHLPQQGGLLLARFRDLEL